MSSQNYQELANIQNNKIMFFCSKIGDNNPSRAERYLTQANWDENLAVENFIRTHPNHVLPSNQNNNAFQFSNIIQNQGNNSGNNSGNKSNIKKSENYLEFTIGESLINSGNNNEPESNSLIFLRNNLKSVEKDYKSFLKLLKERRSGVIIIINNESPNKIKEQIKKINEEMKSKNINQKYIIYSTTNNTKIGNEFVQQLSMVSFPTYIFCRYKDSQNFYITSRMEGAFDASFFSDSILKNIPESNNKSNLNNKKEEANNKKKEDKGGSSFIKEIRKDLNLRNVNKNVNNHRDGNNNRYKDNQKKDESRNQNAPNNNINNNMNNNINNNISINDYYLGDSQEIPNLVNDNNNNMNNNMMMNYNNIPFPNNNAMMNYNNFYPSYFNNNLGYYPNNNYINPIPNYFNSDINNINNNNSNNNRNNNNSNNNRNNNSNADGNLANSIYGLSDGEVLKKQDKEFENLEKQEEEKIKEQKKEEELKKNYEEEAIIAKLKLPIEPEESEPDACKIKFRLPNGEKAIERRFLKTNKVSVLFDFVKSKGIEIFSEPDSNNFELICMGFPPKNLEDKKNNTLEQEEMFPNAILQIQENKKKSQ